MSSFFIPCAGSILFSFSLFGKIVAVCMIANALFNMYILFKYPEYEAVQRQDAQSDIKVPTSAILRVIFRFFTVCLANRGLRLFLLVKTCFVATYQYLGKFLSTHLFFIKNRTFWRTIPRLRSRWSVLALMSCAPTQVTF